MSYEYSSRKLGVVVKFPDGDVEYQSLDIKVRIKKTISYEPNTATITIYNLNRSSRDRLFDWTVNKKENGGPLSVSVFLDGTEVFRNTLINTHSMREIQSGDWITTLYCGDNPRAMKAKPEKKKIEKGANKAKIIDDLFGEFTEQIDSMKAKLEGFLKDDCIHGKSMLRAMTINGTFIDNFKKILKDCFPEDDFFIFVDDNELKILKGGAYVAGAELTVGDDLIDPPSLTESGVNCKVLMRHDAQIGGKLTIDSNNFILSSGKTNSFTINAKHILGQGDYQIMEIQHNVDNFSGELATTDIIAMSLGATYDV